MVGMLLGPIFLFLVGFLFGLVFGAVMDRQFRITTTVVLWLPIVVLLLREYKIHREFIAAIYPVLNAGEAWRRSEGGKNV